ncbi:DUF72 domain-containing protein [Solimonas soli]|uniref:DUF72 domain-containing protein n=1 Tax=Solimonas soli TaxID=413479 RepID=UPI00048918DD|nr:DUF72 domain-containing protein [Solimonas soli]
MTTRTKPQASGTIRTGIGGWNYAPWRETFYPPHVREKDELAYASGRLRAIEVNGTFYRLQTPSTYARWHAETPDDFVFALKAPRFVTQRRVLAEAGDSIRRFLDSGIAELRDKLGPLLWQLPPTHRYDADDSRRFLDLLPARLGGRALRHVFEVRHDSFLVPDFVEALRERGIATVYADSDDYPSFADVTAGFVYARLMRSQSAQATGYAPEALDRWAARGRRWAEGAAPDDLPTVCGTAPPRRARNVFLFFISGAKERNPAAAVALRERLDD